MKPGKRIVTFGDDVRDNISELMSNALQRHGWTQAKAAEMTGVSKSHISSLTHTMPEGIGAGYLLKAFIGVDVDPLDVVLALGITDEVEKHLNDPQDAKHYPTMARVLGKTTNHDITPMEAVLYKVPAHKRELARQLIENILETMSK